MEGRSKDEILLCCRELLCPRCHQLVTGRIAAEGFIGRCLVGVGADWGGWTSYCKRAIDETKNGTGSFSGGGWSGATARSLGDDEGGWVSELCTRHGFAPTDVNMRPPTCLSSRIYDDP